MKPFADLTDEELAALSEDEVAAYVKLALVHAGLPIRALELEPMPAAAAVQPPRTPVYQVESCSFLELAEAQEVAALVARCLTLVKFGYSSDYSKSVLKHEPAAPPEVTMQLVYHEREWAEQAGAVARAKEEQADRNSRLEDLKKQDDARHDIEGPLRDAVRAAVARQKHRAAYAKLLEEYVEIADGDYGTARRFLLRAHPEASEYLPPIEMAATALATAEVK